MERGKARHLFPGGNTSEGFYSYYQYILPQSEAEHIYCIKGGPGVGKSTFMNAIAKSLEEKGVYAEYLHCSSDPDSLDGVLFPMLRIALIDGTAPHVTDPKNPGAVDEIVNLGEYWNLEGIKKHKEQIIDINAETGRLFSRAYRYLAAAKSIRADIEDICQTPGTCFGAKAQADMIIKKEMEKASYSAHEGSIRKMFASAITPSGIVHYIDTLADENYKVYLITNTWGAGVSALLEAIASGAEARGYCAEAFYCPMEPAKRIEHLIIPGLRLAFLSENGYLALNIKPDCIIDLTQYSPESPRFDREDLRESEKEYDALLTEAIFTLRRAKETHDELEKFYVPNMDFARVGRTREWIQERIMEHVK